MHTTARNSWHINMVWTQRGAGGRVVPLWWAFDPTSTRASTSTPRLPRHVLRRSCGTSSTRRRRRRAWGVAWRNDGGVGNGAGTGVDATVAHGTGDSSTSTSTSTTSISAITTPGTAQTVWCRGWTAAQRAAS